MKEITVGNGKYTIVLTEQGTISEIKRHGERWEAGDQFVHAGFVLALVQEIEEIGHELTRQTWVM